MLKPKMSKLEIIEETKNLLKAIRICYNGKTCIDCPYHNMADICEYIYVDSDNYENNKLKIYLDNVLDHLDTSKL